MSAPTPPPVIDGPATVITVEAGPPWCKLPDRSLIYEFEITPEGPGRSRDLMPCGPIPEPEAETVATVAATPPSVPQASELPATGVFTGATLIIAALVTSAGLALRKVAS